MDVNIVLSILLVISNVELVQITFSNGEGLQYEHETLTKLSRSPLQGCNHY